MPINSTVEMPITLSPSHQKCFQSTTDAACVKPALSVDKQPSPSWQKMNKTQRFICATSDLRRAKIPLESELHAKIDKNSVQKLLHSFIVKLAKKEKGQNTNAGHFQNKIELYTKIDKNHTLHGPF